HERRLRRGFRLAPPQRAALHRGWRDLGFHPPRRRRGDGLFAACGRRDRVRRHAGGRAAHRAGALERPRHRGGAPRRCRIRNRAGDRAPQRLAHAARALMLLAERSVAPYRFRHGNGVLLVSMPHAGTFVPHSVGRDFNDIAALRPDTDWHMPRLYDFVRELDASVIVANCSRYVIDVNRPPGGENLYPGRDTPLLCPVDTFDCQPLYRDGGGPSREQVERRVEAIWKPYHRRLASELERIRAAHGIAVLWEAHSIVSRAPRLFDGRLPDFNLGTVDDASCDPELSRALIAGLQRHAGHTAVLNGRFKGSYITRRFG